MQINFIERGKHSLSEEEFASYTGQLPEFVSFYLDAAVQTVETAICKSLSQHKIELTLKEECRKILPYGHIKEIKSLEKLHCDGSTQSLSPKYSRLVKDEIYLPQNEYGWCITYTTKPVEIGPMDKLEIYRVGELLINGDHVCHDSIRQNLDSHRSKVYGTHSRQF